MSVSVPTPTAQSHRVSVTTTTPPPSFCWHSHLGPTHTRSLDQVVAQPCLFSSDEFFSFFYNTKRLGIFQIFELWLLLHNSFFNPSLSFLPSLWKSGKTQAGNTCFRPSQLHRQFYHLPQNMTSLGNFSTLSRLVFPPAAAHKAQVSGGNLIRLNLPSRTGLGRTTLSWPIPMAQFQGPFHISRPVTDTLHVSVPTSLFVRFGCYHQVPETGWFKQKTRISHSSGGWEAQDPGASWSGSLRRFFSWLADAAFSVVSTHSWELCSFSWLEGPSRCHLNLIVSQRPHHWE